MKFALGKIVITRTCLAHMESISERPTRYLLRHASGDWGMLGREDRQANEQAVQYSHIRILSHYVLPDGERIYIITEADRSATTILLRSEY